MAQAAVLYRDYDLPWRCAGRRFRQSDLAWIRKLFDVARVHEQEGHEDRKDIHQRNEIQRAAPLTARMPAPHPRCTASITHRDRL